MIYTLISGLIEKMNKDNDERKNMEAEEKDRREREKEVEELVSAFEISLAGFSLSLFIHVINFYEFF